MFKKYVFYFEYKDGSESSIEFYVNSKKTRNGFMHRSIVIGLIPRLDSSNTDWAKCRLNDDKLMRCRVHKVSYLNRTWESYSGQTCLSEHWKKLANLKFTDMTLVRQSNPFESGNEPPHVDLNDPDELFGRF